MKISVIIPVYNASAYLVKCLNSVLVQTYNNWECIAIDDGSKDNSWEILQDYAKRDARFIVETKKKEGPGLTRNCCLDKVTGEFVVFLDSDDYIEKDYFELLNKVVEKDKSDVVFINIVQETPQGKVICNEKMSDFSQYSRKDMIGFQMTGYMPWGGWRKAVAYSLIDDNSLRYSADATGEEAIYSFELLRHAQKISFIDKPLYHYVNHPVSQSKLVEVKQDNDGTILVSLGHNKMKQHLVEKNIKDEYNACLNALAFRNLILWLLTASKMLNLKDCVKYFKREKVRFENDFGWQLNKKYLKKELRFLLPFIRVNFLLPVVIAAKYINRK